MIGVIKKVDMFGLPFSFLTFGADKFKTSLGGLLSLLICCLGIYFIYFFGEDLFYKKNPKVTLNELIHLETKKVEVTNEKFSFMFRLDNGVGTPYDLNNFPYQFQLSYHHYRYDKKRNIHRICDVSRSEFAIKCSNTKAKLNPALVKENFDLWYCFDTEKIKAACREQIGVDGQDYELIFGGVPDEDEFGGLRVDVCNFFWDYEKRKYTYVATQEETESVYDIYLHFRYPNVSYDSKQPDNPLLIYYESQNIRLDKNVYRFENRYMKIVTSNDDFGWVYPNVTSQTVMAPLFNEFQNLPISEWNTGDGRKGKYYYMALFWNNKTENEYNRSFMKIQDLVAVVSGMLKSFMMVLGLSAFYKANKDRSEEMQERFYKLKVKVSSDVSVQPLVKEATKVNTVVQLNKVKDKDNDTLSFFAYMFKCCLTSPEMTRKLRIFEKMQAYMEEKFDIEYLLKLFEQFTKMKEMVLSEEQKEFIECNFTEIELEA